MNEENAKKNFLDLKWFSFRNEDCNSIGVPGGTLFELKNAAALLAIFLILFHIL
jgi:hypothetical protein